MNKSGHLFITERLSGDLCKRHRFCLKLGSILPDILVHTYIKGHTWSASYEKMKRKMEWLAQTGKPNCISYLSLGYIIHYIEDYFTWPHNTWYTGSLVEHVQYEKAFTNYLQKQSEVRFWTESDCPVSVESLFVFLGRFHQCYEEGTDGFENDYRHILQVADIIAHSYYQMFLQNKQKAEAVLDVSNLSFSINGY